MRLEDAVSQDVINRTYATLRATLREDCCIAASTIFAAVLKNLGFRAELVSVRLSIFNPVFARWLVANDWRNPSEDEVKKLKTEGARVVVVGDGGKPEPGKWPGHLVTAVHPRRGQGSGYLIDLSAPQANRPRKEIKVAQPIRIEMSAERLHAFIDGKIAARGQRTDQSVVDYYVKKGDASYQVSLDWAERKTRYGEHIDELTKGIREFVRAGAATPHAPGVEGTSADAGAQEDQVPKV